MAYVMKNRGCFSTKKRANEIEITINTERLKEQLEEARKEIETLADNSFSKMLARHLLPQILKMTFLAHLIFWVAFLIGLFATGILQITIFTQ